MLNQQHSTQSDEPCGYREVTLAAIILGVIQGVILNVAFCYIALKLGFSIGGSAIAAILGYVFLRILGNGTIVENNINQTIASSINAGGTGVVFVLPAVFMLSADTADISLLTLLFGGLGGAILGIVLIIPLRKQLIELERLRFPTGVAVATIIRSSASSNTDKAKLLAFGVIVSALWTLWLSSGWLDIPGVLENSELNLSFGFIPDYFAPALYLSLLNFAAGLLSGRGGLPFFFGGVVAWWLVSPMSVWLEWTPPVQADGKTLENGDSLVDFIHVEMLRPLGIGILIGAAFMELLMSYPAMKSAILSLRKFPPDVGAGRGVAGRGEMPFTLLVSGAIAAVAFFFLAIWFTPGIVLWQAIIMAIVTVVWMGLAGLIVAQATGMTDISPLSGISLVSVTGVMLLLNSNVAAAMLVAIGVTVAIGQAADMMQDLKTGFLVGSRPHIQQLVQFSASWFGVILAFGTIYLLWHSGTNGQGGFGAGTELPAPQATALSSMIEALQDNSVNVDKFALGAIVGGLLAAAPIAGLGVLTGLAMYLPFSITLGYGLGCLTQILIEQRNGYAYTERTVVPIAAGLIIGEALMGVGHAVYVILMLQQG